MLLAMIIIIFKIIMKLLIMVTKNDNKMVTRKRSIKNYSKVCSHFEKEKKYKIR